MGFNGVFYICFVLVCFLGGSEADPALLIRGGPRKTGHHNIMKKTK